MCPKPEAEWNAHYTCQWCHGLKAKADIIFIDDVPVCRHGDGAESCREQFYEHSHPRPAVRSLGFYDKG